MNPFLIYPAGSTHACYYAAEYLQKSGFQLIDHPAPEVTHLLLDIPSFDGNGQLRGGTDAPRLLERLPQSITVIGGNLTHPALANYRKLDLLQDTYYLAENARITAECALQVAAPLMKTTFHHAPVLILGWGRIGKCLGALLKGMGAAVTVAARKEADLAMLQALGYQTDNIASPKQLQRYRIIFNTIPAPVLDAKQLSQCTDCVKIDLASHKGIICEDLVWAKGLPGIHAPESSGALIAQTISKYLKEGVSWR